MFSKVSPLFPSRMYKVSIGNLDESDNSYSSSSSIVDQSVAESRRKRHTVPPQLTSELLQKHCERYKRELETSLSLPLSIASSSSSNSHTSYDTISQNKSTQNSRTNSECNTEFRHSGKIGKDKILSLIVTVTCLTKISFHKRFFIVRLH